MTESNNNLDPIEPETAQRLFLDHKETDCSPKTVRNYRYRTNHFVRWCELEGISNLNDLGGRDIQQYRLWWKDDGDLNTVTLRMQMSTIRVFLNWAGSIEAVPEDLHSKVIIPRVKPENQRHDETLDANTAEEILAYLARYEYASIEHTVIALLWETGMRLGAAHSLDVDDLNLEETCLHLVHRPDQETTLKNGTNGEQLVALTPELAELLEDYLTVNRIETVDDYGRTPLFTTTAGRMHRNTMRRMVYRVTAPCYRGEPCPDCTDGVASDVRRR